MKGSGEHWKAWGQHIAVIGAYAACYRLAYQLSMSHWELTVGLRLCCLLIVPVRLWPALAFGELLPVIENAFLSMDEFGPVWALAASVPQIVVCMACMLPLRQRWALWGPDGRIRMPYLVSAALCCALMSALRDSTTLWIALASVSKDWGPGVSVSIGFSAYLLGGYLGALTLAPALFAIREQVRKTHSLTAVLRSTLFRDTCAWVVPVLVILAWQATLHAGYVQQAARLAMVLPVIGMAFRHGWHGAALAGMGASIAMALTSTVMRDPMLIECQVALAFVLSAALLMGGKTQPAAQMVSTATLSP
nr:MASE1 domain-containing protein [Luteibacter rhizovicinus]